MSKICFKNSETKHRVQDQLNTMLLITYEVEMHINAIFYISKVFIEADMYIISYNQLWINHDTMALIKTQALFKDNPRCDEIKTFGKLYSFLEGNSININLSGLKEIMNDIKRFTEEHPKLEKIKKRRDSVAHVFKANRSVRVTNDNSVNFKDHLLIILKARELLQNLYKYLFDQKFENIDIDVNLFLKVYENGLKPLNNIND